jgi:hypothetical protein
METPLLKFEGLITDKESTYSNGKPISSKLVRYNNTIDAYTLFNRRNYTPEEFEFLKQYASYHCSAPCYADGMGPTFAQKFQRVKVLDGFYYLVANALVNKIDIF